MDVSFPRWSSGPNENLLSKAQLPAAQCTCQQCQRALDFPLKWGGWVSFSGIMFFCMTLFSSCRRCWRCRGNKGLWATRQQYLTGKSNSYCFYAIFSQLEPSFKWRHGSSPKALNSANLFEFQSWNMITSDSDGVHLPKPAISQVFHPLVLF